jgi:hypothetical protein
MTVAVRKAIVPQLARTARRVPAMKMALSRPKDARTIASDH